MGGKSKLALVVALVAIPGALAAQQPDVSGTWLGDSNEVQKMVIDQKGGNIHIQEFKGDKLDGDLTCTLDGTACTAKENGRKETVMLYFNGPKLVEIREYKGDATKERLSLEDGGKTLTIETVPLSSSQKARTYSLRRQSS